MSTPTFYVEGVEELQARLDRTAANITTKRLMAEIALFLRTRILERTAAGVDVNEHDFEPYSPEYEFVRSAAGLPTEVVDLFFTGSMLSSLTSEETDSQTTLFFINSEDKFGGSNPAKAYYLNEDREFFAMSADDVETITEVARMNIYRALRGNVRRRR
jgi:hypothetical protein